MPHKQAVRCPASYVPDTQIKEDYYNENRKNYSLELQIIQ